MSQTASLLATKVNANQTGIDVTVNTMMDIFDAAIAERLALSVAGSADVTLTDATITGIGQSTYKILEFTGVLTGSINIIVPTLTRHWIMFNNTTGAFTLKVKTVAGTGIFISQGTKAELYCDGTNVVLAKSTGYPQTSISAAYTTVLSDAGKMLYHPGADTTARTFTIDSNANVPYPIGTSLLFVNDSSAGVITISITTDTLVLSSSGSTGSRTLAANGMALAVKMTSTRWIITNLGGLT